MVFAIILYHKKKKQHGAPNSDRDKFGVKLSESEGQQKMKTPPDLPKSAVFSYTKNEGGNCYSKDVQYPFVIHIIPPFRRFVKRSAKGAFFVRK
jgi:hypothetical protein